jgi:hypothetical protein
MALFVVALALDTKPHMNAQNSASLKMPLKRVNTAELVASG